MKEENYEDWILRVDEGVKQMNSPTLSIEVFICRRPPENRRD